MAYTTKSERGIKAQVDVEGRPDTHRPPVTQVLVFERGGACLLWIGPRGANVQEDMFSSVLSALCGFSQEVLGLELTEIGVSQKRLFLAGTQQVIVAIVVNEQTNSDYVQVKTKTHALMRQILDLVVERVEIVGNIGRLRVSNELEFLKSEIEMEITRIFPSCHVDSEAFGLNPIDIPKLRILTHLWDQGLHTFAKIAKDLRMPNFLVKEQLSLLETCKFITTEMVQFGGNQIRTYHISELGKLVLDRIELGFPGLWQ